MNNFVFSQDPLLFQSVIPQQTQNFQDSNNLKQQYDSIMAQYQAMQQKLPPQTPPKDYLGELDTLTREMDLIAAQFQSQRRKIQFRFHAAGVDDHKIIPRTVHVPYVHRNLLSF